MNISQEPKKLPFHQIDFQDSIFDSIRRDYPDQAQWISRASSTASNRFAFVSQAPGGTYSGIIVIKVGEGVDGPTPDAMKLGTFKVADWAERAGIADQLLGQAIAEAVERSMEQIFTAVLPGHDDLVRFLERRGFRRMPEPTVRGEWLYVFDLTDPIKSYSHLNRLAYDLLAEEYIQRNHNPGVNQESPEYLAGLLTRHLESSNGKRLLELGPGPGDVLAAFSAQGFSPIAIELSPVMAAISAERCPEALVIIANALEVQFAPGTFDGIYAGAFLHLFPIDDARRMVERLTRWLKPTGHVFLNTTIGPVSKEHVEVKRDYLRRVARYRARWSEEEFRQLIEMGGLDVCERVVTDEKERDKFWVAYICSPRKVVPS